MTSVQGTKQLLRRALGRANIDVRRMEQMPFGARWEDDLKYCLAGHPMCVALDVGAHWGETALKLLHAFPGVQVHSFEPLHENFATLQATTAGGSVRNVHAAVSDASGTVKIVPGKTTLHASVERDGDGIDVQSLTIDEYMLTQELDRAGLLKIDTEGHEEAVLRGSMSHLENGSIEFVLCECDFTARPEEPHGDFRSIFALLEPLGYRVVSFYTGGVDNLGWLWGDVLFRFAPGIRDHRSIALSPYARTA
jgi:FkbM family methyltransferase